MTLKLDDFLTKKKEPAQILDLSKVSANSQEELKKTMEKVPEYKIKMDKIVPEDVKIFDKKSSTKLRNEDAVKIAPNRTAFAFANPIPCDMRSLRLEDLCSVNIQWKMLTSLRPKTKSDEDYFSKLVELGKLHLHARQKERNKCFAWYERKSKNKAGITEIKIISCRECGEEFCQNEVCRVFGYESYERYVTLDEKQQQQQQHQQQQQQRQNDTGATNNKNCKQIKKLGARVKKRYGRNTRKPAPAPTTPTSYSRSNGADTYAAAANRNRSCFAFGVTAVAGSTLNSNNKKPNRRVKSKIKRPEI